MADPQTEAGWFADRDRDVAEPYVWQPCFETGRGHIPCFEIWFETKAECEAWIAETVIGAGWLSGEPTTPRAEGGDRRG